MDLGGVSSNVLSKLNYSFPPSVDGSLYQPVLTKVFPTTQPDNTGAFNAGDTIQFDIGSSSDLYLDTQNSYLCFRAKVGSTRPVGITDKLSNPIVLAAGLPFESISESVNGGSVQVSSWSQNFARYSGLPIICGSKPAIGSGEVVSIIDTSDAGVPRSWMSYQCTHTEWPNHVTSGGANWQLRQAADSEQAVNDGFHFTVPLPQISQLADSSVYLPIGMLSQSSASGLRINLRMPNTNELSKYVVAPSRLRTQFDLPTTLQLFDVFITCRWCRILDASVLSAVLGAFDRVPMQIAGTSIPSRLLIPFYAKQVFTEHIATGETFVRRRFPISQKNIMGCCMRITEPTAQTSVSFEKNTVSSMPYMKDLLLQLSNSTVMPLTPITSRTGEGTAIQSDLFQGYAAARHLFDSFHQYSDSPAAAAWYTVSGHETGVAMSRTINAPLGGNNAIGNPILGAQRAWPTGVFWSLENFSQNNSNDSSLSSGSLHARGHNSIINDNQLSVSFQIVRNPRNLTPQPGDSYVLEFTVVYLQILQVSRGSISLVASEVV